VIGVPFDGGCTYRSGTRFGPQGIRRISALYTPYNYEMGVDLREQMSLCDAGDVFTIPANLEKSFDQVSIRTCKIVFLFLCIFRILKRHYLQ
jgi:agmatinase